jgi:hypothetical protein
MKSDIDEIRGLHIVAGISRRVGDAEGCTMSFQESIDVLRKPGFVSKLKDQPQRRIRTGLLGGGQESGEPGPVALK